MAVAIFVHERNDFIIEEAFWCKPLFFQTYYSLEKRTCEILFVILVQIKEGVC